MKRAALFLLVVAFAVSAHSTCNSGDAPPPPDPNPTNSRIVFTATGERTVQLVIFTYAGDFTCVQPASFTWDFGDGTTATTAQPAVTHTYISPRNYIVAVFVQQTSKAEPSFALTAVVAFPQCDQCAPLEPSNTFITWAGADGSCTPAVPCYAGEAVNFSVGTIQGATSCLIYTRSWNFGDGTTSSDNAPAHIFASPGIYHVTVTMTTNGGCNPPQSFALAADLTMLSLCDAAPLPNTSNTFITWTDASGQCTPQAKACAAGTALTFSPMTLGYAFGGYTMLLEWDLGDGTRATGVAVTHGYAVPGTYDVRLTITVPGCLPAPVVLESRVTASRPRRRSCCH